MRSSDRRMTRLTFPSAASAPVTPSPAPASQLQPRPMAITADVKSQLFRPSGATEKLIRLPAEPLAAAARAPASPSSPSSPGGSSGRAWTPEEHDRFLEGLEMFPSGPWKEIAAHVGTRTTRQTMTHAQKYREKIARRKRGLRAPSSASAAAAASNAANRRRQQQTHAMHIKQEQRPQQSDVSPRGVADAFNVPMMHVQLPVASPDAPPALCEDPLDFSGCFAPAGHEWGALLADVEPLPMSEEEIDQLLDAATMLHPVQLESAFHGFIV